MAEHSPALPGARLFGDYDLSDLGVRLDRAARDPHEPTADFVIERLFEDGDGDDLRALTRRCGQSTLRAALVRRTGLAGAGAGPSRGLSRRSRAFWTLLLGEADGGPERMAAPKANTARQATAEAIWPL